MKKIKIILLPVIVILSLVLISCMGISAFATEPETSDNTQSAVASTEQQDNTTGTKALASAVVVGVAAAAGTVAMGIAIGKSAEGISRQPEAAGKINSAMMLGLVFIETLIIYALIVAILIIFVL